MKELSSMKGRAWLRWIKKLCREFIKSPSGRQRVRPHRRHGFHLPARPPTTKNRRLSLERNRSRHGGTTGFPSNRTLLRPCPLRQAEIQVRMKEKGMRANMGKEARTMARTSLNAQPGAQARIGFTRLRFVSGIHDLVREMQLKPIRSFERKTLVVRKWVEGAGFIPEIHTPVPIARGVGEQRF